MCKLAGKWMHICRLFLGVIFLVAGVNGYFVIFGLEPFIATSPEAMALFEFNYLLIAVKSVEIICGILLLTNQFIPLAIALLSPLIANIFLLHLFLDHSLLLFSHPTCPCPWLFVVRLQKKLYGDSGKKIKANLLVRSI